MINNKEIYQMQDDIRNKYNKSETYSKEEVDEKFLLNNFNPDMGELVENFKYIHRDFNINIIASTQAYCEYNKSIYFFESNLFHKFDTYKEKWIEIKKPHSISSVYDSICHGKYIYITNMSNILYEFNVDTEEVKEIDVKHSFKYYYLMKYVIDDVLYLFDSLLSTSNPTHLVTFNTVTRETTNMEFNEKINTLGTAITYVHNNKPFIFYNKNNVYVIDEIDSQNQSLINKAMIDGYNPSFEQNSSYCDQKYLYMYEAYKREVIRINLDTFVAEILIEQTRMITGIQSVLAKNGNKIFCLSDGSSPTDMPNGFMGCIDDVEVTNLQLNRTTDDYLKTYIGYDGQLVKNNTSNRLHLMDGTTPSGTIIPNMSDLEGLGGGGIEYIETFEQFKVAILSGDCTIHLLNDCIINFTENLATSNCINIYGNNAIINLGIYRLSISSDYIEKCTFNSNKKQGFNPLNYNYNTANSSLVIISDFTKSYSMIKLCEFNISEFCNINMSNIENCVFTTGYYVMHSDFRVEQVFVKENNFISSPSIFLSGFVSTYFLNNNCDTGTFIGIVGNMRTLMFKDNKIKGSCIDTGYKSRLKTFSAIEYLCVKGNVFSTTSFKIYGRGSFKSNISIQNNIFIEGTTTIKFTPENIAGKRDGSIYDNTFQKIYTLTADEESLLTEISSVSENSENPFYKISIENNISNNYPSGDSSQPSVLLDLLGGYDDLHFINNSNFSITFIPPSFHCRNIYVENNKDIKLTFFKNNGPSGGKALELLKLQNNFLDQSCIDALSVITTNIKTLLFKDNKVVLADNLKINFNITDCNHIIVDNMIFSNSQNPITPPTTQGNNVCERNIIIPK